mgnify:CR=1 FL=1
MQEYVKVELIERFIKENGLTNTGFCKQCKIGYATFLKIKRGEYSVRVSALFRIAKVMGVHVKEILKG